MGYLVAAQGAADTVDDTKWHHLNKGEGLVPDFLDALSLEGDTQTVYA